MQSAQQINYVPDARLLGLNHAIQFTVTNIMQQEFLELEEVVKSLSDDECDEADKYINPNSLQNLRNLFDRLNQDVKVLQEHKNANMSLAEIYQLLQVSQVELRKVIKIIGIHLEKKKGFKMNRVKIAQRPNKQNYNLQRN